MNVSGRFDLSRGSEERLGKEGLKSVEEKGFFDVKDSQGGHRLLLKAEKCKAEQVLTDTSFSMGPWL